jgi:hypothetical protein
MYVSFNNFCYCDSVRCSCLHHLELESVVGIVRCGVILSVIHHWGNTLFITLPSTALWGSDGSFRSSLLAVMIHICRNNLLDDTSGPVAKPKPKVRSSGSGEHRIIYLSCRTSLRVRVRHRSGPRTKICIWAVEYHWTILQADTTRTSENLVLIYQCTRCIFTEDP